MSRRPGERHLQRARDRRRAHRDHVDLELQLAHQLLLLDAEALLLVDHQQAEVLRAHVAREQPVRADQDVDLALGEALDRLALIGGGAEARDVLDLERLVAQALDERAVVLLGEDRRRHEHQDLLAVGGRLDRRAQRDLGLAVADVAADQPVHRALGLHVGDHGRRSRRAGRASRGRGSWPRGRAAPRRTPGTRGRGGACARRRGSAARRRAPARRGGRAP